MSDDAKVVPPITEEDLKALEVTDPDLINLIVSTAIKAKQSPTALTPEEVGSLLVWLDKLLSSEIIDAETKKRCLKLLREVSSAREILRPSYYLQNVSLIEHFDVSRAPGRLFDIWAGQLNGGRVEMKVLCIISTLSQTSKKNLTEINRRLHPEFVGWKYLVHPNVVPFLGVSGTERFPLCIITPWLENGSILEYTKKNQEVNRLGLLAQAAAGLEYLHSLGIVHGAIDPENILIDQDGTARLVNFGIINVIGDLIIKAQREWTEHRDSDIFKLYWAQELFDSGGQGCTEESDIHSFGMTAYAVLTGGPPFGASPLALSIRRLTFGGRPTRPVDAGWVPEEIWGVLEQCWHKRPSDRPKAQVVYKAFRDSSHLVTATGESDHVVNSKDGAMTTPEGKLMGETGVEFAVCAFDDDGSSTYSGSSSTATLAGFFQHKADKLAEKARKLFHPN